MATNVPAAAPPVQPHSTSQPRRPLQRENAMIFLTNEEQELQDMMLRSSPMPDPGDLVLGKRAREGENLGEDGNDTEPDMERDNGSQTTIPSLSNATVAIARYSAYKKLRAHQRGEVDAFLLVSNSKIHELCRWYPNSVS